MFWRCLFFFGTQNPVGLVGWSLSAEKAYFALLPKICNPPSVSHLKAYLFTSTAYCNPVNQPSIALQYLVRLVVRSTVQNFIGWKIWIDQTGSPVPKGNGPEPLHFSLVVQSQTSY